MMTANISLAKRPRPEYARIRLALAQSIHFHDLPAASLDRLAANAKLARFRNGEVVHESGLLVSKLWFVLAGGLRVSWPKKDGRTVAMAVLGEGSFYSVGALLEGTFSETVCHAVGDTTTAVMDGEALRRIAEEDPDIGKLVPRLMLGHFWVAVSLFADILTAPLRERLGRRLLTHALASRRSGGQAEFELPMTQSDLAEMLGASRSKVSVELRRLEKEGVIRIGYRRLFVLDVGRLCEIAGPMVHPL
jgi:CRP-like cAMP-binding protein